MFTLIRYIGTGKLIIRVALRFGAGNERCRLRIQSRFTTMYAIEKIRLQILLSINYSFGRIYYQSTDRSQEIDGIFSL